MYAFLRLVPFVTLVQPRTTVPGRSVDLLFCFPWTRCPNSIYFGLRELVCLSPLFTEYVCWENPGDLAFVFPTICYPPHLNCVFFPAASFPPLLIGRSGPPVVPLRIVKTVDGTLLLPPLMFATITPFSSKNPLRRCERPSVFERGPDPPELTGPRPMEIFLSRPLNPFFAIRLPLPLGRCFSPPVRAVA